MSHHDLHHGDHDASGKMSFKDKLSKILDHWVHHNEDHAQTLREWAQKAREEGFSEAAALLLEAARTNLEINEKLREATNGLNRESLTGC